MKTALALSHYEVAPGQQGFVDIDVTNNIDVIDGITAIIDGINPDWIRLERPVLSLFPDASDILRLVLDIPPTCPAGDYLVIVRIVSTIDVDRQTVHDFWLTVSPAPAIDIQLTPSIVSGGKNALLAATILNTGNTALQLTVDALEPTREIDCTTNPTSLHIPHGHEALVDVDMRGKRPWFGDPVSRSVTITARSDDVIVEKIGTFRQKPKIPRGLLTALILAGIVLLWALIFWFVVSELRSTEPPAKAVGTDFMTGPDNIPLAAVAGTLEGAVTATTTGNGVPRITVEAQRVTSDGTLDPVGSAATDDDGKFSLKSLIPGTYKVRFSADGYETVWFEQGVDEATATELRLDPQQVLDDLNIQMTGDTGRLLGSVALPPDAPPTPLTVTATQVVEQSGTDGEPAAPPFTAEQVTTDGTINLAGLPTPATYTVTVSGPGFDTQQFEQTLSGGEASVVNTVSLTAADGAIEGTVRDATGAALGGVTVTARSGDIEVTSITPTTGNVGQFRIVGLETPQTYALTFELANYSSTTAALSLAAGESRTGLAATLVGGSGTVTGVAVDDTGAALGGVTVVVLGDEFRSETTTLTTSGAGGAAGSFTVTDLPVPAAYTISLGDDQVQTETLGATFLAAGTQSVGSVTLLSIDSQVRGVVSAAGGGGLGEVTITLSDGVRPRVTTSATNPPGAYAFANVPPGAYTLEFARSGFTTKVVLVDVVAGIDLDQNASLDAAAP